MGLLLYALSSFLIPLARGPLVVSGVFLASQQLFDFGLAVCEKTEFSLRQSIVSNRMLGRVNASMTVAGQTSQLAGSLIAGVLAEAVGMRWAMTAG